jgi:CubicO group peptidase (beta-lactamase class C family)
MTDFDATLQSAVSELNITGASFAYWNGNELVAATAGVRNSATGDPVTRDTVMHIGSITKVLNAVLLMQLVDDEAIRLDDPVAKYLPRLRLRDSQALGQITCEMLLNHTSGIDGDWLPEPGPDRERIADAIEACADLSQLFAPGEATSYCNIATVIAGFLVQELRGESWYTLIEKRIFEPLEMCHALARVSDAPRFRCSIGDLTDPEFGASLQTRRPFLSPAFAPAGSTLMTSAADLVTFARALLDGGVGPNGARILSAASTARMATPTTSFVWPRYRMALGWMITPAGVLTHSGVGPGVQSVLFADSRSRRAMALLTNCDRGATLRARITNPILEAWAGSKKAPKPARSDAVDTRAYEGVYENNLQRFDVRYEDGELWLRVEWKMPLYDTSLRISTVSKRSPSRMRPIDAHTFAAPSPIPGAPPLELKLTAPDADGRMHFLATGYRLLARRAT